MFVRVNEGDKMKKQKINELIVWAIAIIFAFLSQFILCGFGYEQGTCVIIGFLMFMFVLLYTAVHDRE